MNNEIKIITQGQVQHWPEFDRVVIVATDPLGILLGTVQINLYPEEQGFRSTAFLYALWVGIDYRWCGVASRLMRDAETIAANRGHKSIALECDATEVPQWVCQWYARLGYDKKEFTPGKRALMIKELKETQQ